MSCDGKWYSLVGTAKVGGMKILRQNYAIFGRGGAAAEHNTLQLMRTVQNIGLFLLQWKSNRGF